MIPHDVFIDFSNLQGRERVRAQRRLQEKLIDMGFYWPTGPNVPKYLDAPYLNFNCQEWDRLALAYIGEGEPTPPSQGSVTFDAETERDEMIETAQAVSRLRWWRN